MDVSSRMGATPGALPQAPLLIEGKTFPSPAKRAQVLKPGDHSGSSQLQQKPSIYTTCTVIPIKEGLTASLGADFSFGIMHAQHFFLDILQSF